MNDIVIFWRARKEVKDDDETKKTTRNDEIDTRKPYECDNCTKNIYYRKCIRRLNGEGSGGYGGAFTIHLGRQEFIFFGCYFFHVQTDCGGERSIDRSIDRYIHIQKHTHSIIIINKCLLTKFRKYINKYK